MLTTEQINNASYAFITASDVGCLAIGNDDFYIRFHNGYGDTDCNHVYVFEETIDIDIHFFVTDIEGTFDIYNYDCLNTTYRSAKSCVTLSGHYNIYKDTRVFAFVKL